MNETNMLDLVTVLWSIRWYHFVYCSILMYLLCI